MTLNPQVAAMIALMRDAPPIDYATITAPQMRATFDQPMTVGPPPVVARAEDIELALPGRTLSARLYVPEGAVNPPLTLFLHGGGWVVGTLDTHDGTARALARESGSAILSLAYRLAPEHPYPAAVEDSYDALCWAAENGVRLGYDGTRLAVAGDSAGGNLAAACAILARDRGGPALRHQLLIYPVTDVDFSRPSYVENGDGEYVLSTDMMTWFWNHYLSGRDIGDAPLAAMLRCADLSGLPSATIITAEFDPLRDEGMTYAARLVEAGVATESEIAPGMIHGFISMFEAIPDAMPWIEKSGRALRAALA